jgi:hypothetical protein
MKVPSDAVLWFLSGALVMLVAMTIWAVYAAYAGFCA